jgi:hypothetical protein
MSAVAPDAIGPDFIAHRAASAYTVELDGEAVVLDEEQNRLHLLNHTATLLWACLDGTGTLAEIAADVAATVGMPVTQIMDDVVALARTLGAEGLLAGVTPDDDRAGVVVEPVEAS